MVLVGLTKMPYTKEQVKEIKKEWDKSDLMKEYIKGRNNFYCKEYNKRRRKKDIKFKLLGNLRMRLYMALKGRIKLASAITLLGCSINYLMDYIESQFDDEMSWTNYGTWHIDHIEPCSNFDLSNEEEQRKCFNYSNLQPLWAMDNLRKSNISSCF